MNIFGMEVNWPKIRQWVILSAPYVSLFVVIGLGIRGPPAVGILVGIQVGVFLAMEVQSLLAKAKRIQIAHQGHPFQARIYNGHGDREIVDEVLKDPKVIYKAVKGKVEFQGEDIPFGLFAVKCKLRRPVELFGKVYSNVLLLLPSTLEISLPLTKDIYLEIDGEIIQTLASSFEALQLNDLGVMTVLGDLAKDLDIEDTAIWYVFGSDFIARLLKEKLLSVDVSEMKEKVEKGEIQSSPEVISEILKIRTDNIFDAVCIYFSHLLREEKTQTEVFKKYAQDIKSAMRKHEARAFVEANRIADLRAMAFRSIPKIPGVSTKWSYVFYALIGLFVAVLGIAIYKHYHPNAVRYVPPFLPLLFRW